MCDVDRFIDKYIKKQTNKYKTIFNVSSLKRRADINILVIDNFYSDPQAVTSNVLTLDFNNFGNGDSFNVSSTQSKNPKFPGMRTRSYASTDLLDKIQTFVEPYGGRIETFYIPDENSNCDVNHSNGCFQITSSYNKSYIHTDNNDEYIKNNWSGILYLSEDVPLESGTHFYQYENGSATDNDSKCTMINGTQHDNRYDFTSWKLINKIGNVYNRLILFKSDYYHISGDYFGNESDDFRLTQVFFFKTEY